MKSDTIEKKIIYIIGLLIMLPILTYRGLEWGIIILVVFMGFTIIKTKKINNNSIFLILFICSVATILILYVSSLEQKWKIAGTKGFIYFFIITIFCLTAKYLLNQEKKTYFIKGIKCGCIIQLIWSGIQYFSYSLLKIDINNLIFFKLLNITNTTSRISSISNTIQVSGMGWHPALLVPILVLSYLLFDNVYIKILLLVVATITRNSTCMFAIILCFFLEYVVLKNRKKTKSLTKKTIFIAIISSIIFLTILYINRNIFSIVSESVDNLFKRLNMVFTNDVTDLSTSYHSRYYTFLPYIISNSKGYNVLFGYGYECSGYPFTHFLNQYSNYNAWIAESDPINFIIGRGIIWTIIYYYWLIKNAIKGYKISNKYGIFFTSIILCGILYNNQFLWVMIIEVFFAYCISKNIDIFSLNSKTNTN